MNHFSIRSVARSGSEKTVSSGRALIKPKALLTLSAPEPAVRKHRYTSFVKSPAFRATKSRNVTVVRFEKRPSWVVQDLPESRRHVTLDSALLSPATISTILASSSSASERAKATNSAAMCRAVTLDFASALADIAYAVAWNGERSRTIVSRSRDGWVADQDFWFVLRDCLVLDPNKVGQVLESIMTDSINVVDSERRYKWGRIERIESGIRLWVAISPKAPPSSRAALVSS